MRLWKGLDDIIFPKPLQWGALYSAGARYSAGEIAWHDLDPSIVRVPNYSGPKSYSAGARYSAGEIAWHIPAL